MYRLLMIGGSVYKSHEYSGALRLLLGYMNDNKDKFRVLESGLCEVLDIEEFTQSDVGGYTVVCRLQAPISIMHQRIYVPDEIMEKMFRQEKINRIKENCGNN